MTTVAFPCSLTLDIPFPDARLASAAHRALRVDKELSQLVRRSFSVREDEGTVLRVLYEATTNRMLRVAVNSFMDSLALVVEVMEHLDSDVLEAEGHAI